MGNEITSTREAIIDETIKDQSYMDDGVIIKPEKRSTIGKLKKWYYEHIIATGKSAKWEENIDKEYKIMKKAVVVAGAAASIVLLFVPGGQLGSAASILATPALIKLLSLKADLEKKALITLKRKAEEAMGFGNEGHSEKVDDADLSLDELVDGVATIKKESPQIIDQSGQILTDAKNGTYSPKGTGAFIGTNEPALGGARTR